MKKITNKTNSKSTLAEASITSALNNAHVTPSEKVKGDVVIGRADDVTKAVWGKIYGDIENQTDLVELVENHHDDTKQDIIDKYLINAKVSDDENSLTIKDSQNREVTFSPETGKVDNVLVNGQSVVSNKIAWVEVPTKTSELTNDAGFVDKKVNNLVNYRKTSDQDVIDNRQDASIATNTSEIDSLKTRTSTAESNIASLQSGKQDVISDLSTIRSNASKGSIAKDTIDTYGNIVTHNTSEFATAEQGTKADNAVPANSPIEGATKTKITYDSKGLVTAGADLVESDIPSLHLTKISDVTATAAQLNNVDDTILKQEDIINNVQTTSAINPLSANMGKELQDQINNLKNIGRFLSIWNCLTGLPTTDPTELPYTYRTGDYFRVGAAAEGSETNYRPNGSTYTGQASTTVETEEIRLGDVYYYDGTSWLIQYTGSGGKVQDVQVNSTSVVSSETGIANIKLNNFGITATVQELNKLDGMNASTTELNSVTGITGNVQLQLDNKLAKNADITAGTHTKITYDAKGLVTSGADLTVSDIPSLTLSKISDVTASASELNKLSGVTTSTAQLNYLNTTTSDVQSQINSKSTVSVSDSGSATDEVRYITVNGTEKKLSGLPSGGSNGNLIIKDSSSLGGAKWTDAQAIYVSDGVVGTTVTINADTLQGHNAAYFQQALPTVTNDRYLHTNSSTGALEWSTVQQGGVTGVKGNSEQEYRTGQVNLTAANLGLGNVENKSSATIRSEITSSDIPSLDASKITSGTFADARIASASMWNDKQSALIVNPTETTATLNSLTINGVAYSLGGELGYLETYSITATLTNCTGTIPRKIRSDETVTITITASTGYVLPDSVTVIGATSSWTKNTGTLILSNATENVSFSIIAEDRRWDTNPMTSAEATAAGFTWGTEV